MQSSDAEKKLQVALTHKQWAALGVLADMGLAYIRAAADTMTPEKRVRAQRFIADGGGAMLEVHRRLKGIAEIQR